jgi:hypothetical protein
MTLKRTEFKRKAPIRTARPTGVLAQASFVKVRAKKCAVCRQPFTPSPPGAKVCSPKCAEAFGVAATATAARAAAKAVRAGDKARLIAMKPLKWHRAKAKTAMHAFVRARDEGKECASCDTLLIVLGRMGGDYDAGHFRPVGLAKHLEFDPRNIWGQCKPCNDHKRGNFQAYEAKLRLREGDGFVDELLADNAPRHLKIHDFQEIEAHYKTKLRQLKGK